MEFFNSLKKKIKSRELVISVIGLGYVGLPLGLSFAAKGFKVYGIDKDIKKIEQLKKNKIYINSVDKNILVRLNKKFFFPTSDFKYVTFSDAVIICVPTPINKFKKPDMRYVKGAVDRVKQHIKKGHILILECTTYPGTTEEYFLPIIKKKQLIIGKDIFLGYSPEREDPGNKDYSITKGNLPKVTSGYSTRCLDLVSSLYNRITKKIYKAENIMSAEFSKLLENIYRSVNISLVNELALVASKLNLNIYDIIKASSSKPFGFNPFYPGPGVGGHCIPVDPYYLSWKAKKLGISLKFIKVAGEVNDKRPFAVSQKIITNLRKLKYKKNKFKIVIFGAAYKKDSDDIRESPAKKIINELKKISKKVYICDPMLNKMSKKMLEKFTFLKKDNEFYKFNKRNDIAVIVTNHKIFNYKLIKKNFSLVFDCRNSFSEPDKKIIQV